MDKALDEVRPYLIADGGNVEVAAVQDGVVMLRLQGACGTCPSSTATMKMGIERSLRVCSYYVLPLYSLCDVFVQLPTLSGCKPACHTCCVCQQHDDRCIRIIDAYSAQYCVSRCVSRNGLLWAFDYKADRSLHISMLCSFAAGSTAHCM